MKLKFSLVDDEITISDSEGEIPGDVTYIRHGDVNGLLLSAYEDSIELLAILMDASVIHEITHYVKEIVGNSGFSMSEIATLLEGCGIEKYDEDE